jgi:hypothetical protein
MSCESRCERVLFKVTSLRLVHITPRPRAGAPASLEHELSESVRRLLESDTHTAPAGCDCVTGEPIEVEAREQYNKVVHGEYTAWFKVRIAKYRTPGECMPAGDPLPEGVRG